MIRATAARHRDRESWLSLAAAPTFAVMALLTLIHDVSMASVLCSATPAGSLLTGMVPMYMLMSAFHLPPWLRLLTRQRKQV
jgi:hypothetical protein